MESIKLDSSVTAICCLKGHPGVVLVGVGNLVEVYRSDRIAGSVSVFDSTSASVHGFVESGNSDRVIVFGSKQLEVLRVSNSPDLTLTSIDKLKITCEDWIFAARWTSEDTVLVLTAHNRVIKLEIGANNDFEASSDVVKCEEKCILYSGQIVEDHNPSNEAAVLAGTVFSELVIW